MNTWEIGLIQGLMPFLGLFTKLALSYLSDRCNIHKIVMSTSIALWAIGYELMLLLPAKSIHSSPVNESRAQTTTAGTTQMVINNSNNLRGNDSATESNPEMIFPGERHPMLFFYSFICLMMINLSFAPIFSLFDAMSFNVLDRSENQGSFGSIRAWAAAGYMVFSPISGMGMTHLGKYHARQRC